MQGESLAITETVFEEDGRGYLDVEDYSWCFKTSKRKSNNL